MTSQYKGVCYDKSRRNGSELVRKWRATFTNRGTRKSSHHLTEREAAVAYDKFLIDAGKAPVNILKPKL